MGGIAPSPNGSTSVGIERAWSYIKLLRSESMGIPALFWKTRVCANDMSKTETLRKQYENVFTREDFKQRSNSPRISYEDIPDIIYLQYPWYSEAALVQKAWQGQWTWSNSRLRS